MKPAPHVAPPPLIQSDYLDARRTLGHEPKRPVGLVLSVHGWNELRAYGVKFPCPVAVDPRAPRDTCAWYWLEANFDKFIDLLRA